MAVLVGLAASKCAKTDYYSQELCEENCDFPEVMDNRYVEGRCKISNTFKKKYGNAATVYRHCWRCIAEPVD